MAQSKVKYINRYGVEKWVTAKQAANWSRQRDVMRETNRRAAEMRKQSSATNKSYKSYLRAAKQMTDETIELSSGANVTKRQSKEYVVYRNRYGVEKRVTKKQAANWARQREVMYRTNIGVGEGRSRKEAARKAREDVSKIDTAVWDNFFIQLVDTLQAEIDNMTNKWNRHRAQSLLEAVKGEEAQLTEYGKIGGGRYLQEEGRGASLQELITRIVYASMQSGLGLYNKQWVPFIETLNAVNLDSTGAFSDLAKMLYDSEDEYADDDSGWDY